jgi:hypothetical protein
MIVTVMTTDCAEGERLRQLQRELAWRGRVLERFHAVDDRNEVRHEVFDLISQSNVRIDATVLDKTKAQPHLAGNPVRFYKQASFLHFKYVIPRVTTRRDELMVVASSLQVKKKRAALHDAVEDVVHQVSPTRRYVTAFHKNETDPCLQLADYAAWAIQRWFERDDKGWYDVIEDNVASVFAPFAGGSTRYY